MHGCPHHSIKTCTCKQRGRGLDEKVQILGADRQFNRKDDIENKTKVIKSPTQISKAKPQI